MDISMESALNHLYQIWGFKDFNKEQSKIIPEILKGNDTFTILTSGGGKSLCFQLPALMMTGTTIVISPLQSLMQDQVQKLQKIGISAEFINSNLSELEKKEVYRKFFEGELKLLYLSPEKFTSKGFAEFIKTVRIPMIVIDEAHLVELQKDFRYSFKKIGKTIQGIKKLQKKVFGDKAGISVHCFTATATKETESRIIESIQFSPKKIRFVEGRTNLNIFTKFFEGGKADKMKCFFSLIKVLRNLHGNKMIFFSTIKEAKEVQKMLKILKLEVGIYHGEMAPSRKISMQKRFLGNKFDFMLGTKSLGTGIDKGDVSVIIHLGIPTDIEEYAQQIGRAGRDKQESVCILLFDYSDISITKLLIRGNNGDRDEKYRKLDYLVEECKSGSLKYQDIQQYLNS